ncbi:hypothetical protein ZIOFF_040968 [Zingiber officinale]|uniref:Uncharacterized protein n=1 Tax=Zingiber officinale TaxID=94328 RepID=A0A8J5L515_ZINOF|nr:hypothetical protein ZIOFF_040968 [Zingiber officinale]
MLHNSFRYYGKSKALMNDVTKIISTIKGKRGEHRHFRLAENLCMNLILSIRDFFVVKKELKGPTDFTETINRITIISLAITIKTRGVADVEHMLYLQPLLEQIMATSCLYGGIYQYEQLLACRLALIQYCVETQHQHYHPLWIVEYMNSWSSIYDKAEATVFNQCTQLLSPFADPTYVMAYLSHSFPQHRQYLCAGAWMLMNGLPESINSTNLGRVLRELPPEEVTSNIYTMVDALLHQIQVELQHGLPAQDLLSKAVSNFSFFIWSLELLPLDIIVLTLIDRDDDPYALRIVISLLDKPELQQRIRMYCTSRSPEHWAHNQLSKRVELQKALGNHLSWKDRYPTFFDDIAARLIPVIPLVVYWLIENDATDIADRVLNSYTQLMAFHPLRFSFVRDTLAYFYGHLPNKLILRILKIPFSESFPQYMASPNSSVCPPQEYFANLLLGLVNNVIPSLNSKSKSDNSGDSSGNFGRATSNRTQATSITSSDGQKAFYENQDPGTYTQLVLETAAIEILSLPASASQVVASLVQIIVHIQPMLIQSGSGISHGQTSGLPTSPSAGSTESMNTSRSTFSTSWVNANSFVSKSGYSCQQLSCLMIQACGLLLAQLPPEFHLQLYSEAARIIKDCWWLVDGKRSLDELESAVGNALLDSTWASQDNTSTAIGGYGEAK